MNTIRQLCSCHCCIQDLLIFPNPTHIPPLHKLTKLLKRPQNLPLCSHGSIPHQAFVTTTTMQCTFFIFSIEASAGYGVRLNLHIKLHKSSRRLLDFSNAYDEKAILQLTAENIYQDISIHLGYLPYIQIDGFLQPPVTLSGSRIMPTVQIFKCAAHSQLNLYLLRQHFFRSITEAMAKTLEYFREHMAPRKKQGDYSGGRIDNHRGIGSLVICQNRVRKETRTLLCLGCQYN